MSETHFHTIEADGICATLDLRVGHVRRLVIAADGRKIEPLHTAPWVDDASVIEDEALLPNLRFLSGDFFCAPFGGSDVEEAPPHGWPANAAWTLIGEGDHPKGGTIARYQLARTVMGAEVIKELTVRDGHPFLYERHIFRGGNGAVPVANHAMTRFAAGGTLSFSPKRFGMTPATPLETDPAMGRFHLAYPARFEDLTQAPTAAGGTADVTRYPFADRHEDFVALVEAADSALGWAAAIRPDHGDLFLSLKNPDELPLTMLWFSNGGRDYAPWNGRHVGVLGIEEGRTYAGYGHRASIEANPLTELGIPTALELQEGGEASMRNVIGGIGLPDGWTRVAAIEIAGEGLELVDAGGARRSLPYDAGFLARS